MTPRDSLTSKSLNGGYLADCFVLADEHEVDEPFWISTFTLKLFSPVKTRPTQDPPSIAMEDTKFGPAALFAPMSAPVLESVDLRMERYEPEVAARRAELPALYDSPYLPNIDRSLLYSPLCMVDLEDVAPNATVATLTNEQIEKYMTSLVKPTAGCYSAEKLIKR